MPVKTKPSIPSITSAIEKVSSTDIMVSVAGRSREISSRCIATPSAEEQRHGDDQGEQRVETGLGW